MPDQLSQLLDQIDRLDQEATPGPWRYEHTESPTFLSGPDLQEITNAVWSDTDAIYIELARTALPQLAKALQAVTEYCQKMGDPFLAGQIMQAITDAIGDDDD